ncbi:MAG: (d)CMP kinase, partial [Acetobacteraceae bacterium]
PAFDVVRADMAARDAADAARAVSPLRPAVDAIWLDTTDLDADAAFARALRAVEERLGEKLV